MYRISTILLLGIGTAVVWIRSVECFQPTTISLRSPGARARPLSRAGASELRVSEEDRERDLKFERELDRDAELWVNGDPKKRELWDKAKAWRRVNQREYSCGCIQHYTAAHRRGCLQHYTAVHRLVPTAAMHRDILCTVLLL